MTSLWKSVDLQDIEAIRELWNKLPKRDNVYSHLDGRNADELACQMARGFMAFEMPFGYVWLEYNTRDSHVYAHGGFWGSGLYRNIRVLEDLLQFLLNGVGIEEIRVVVPAPLKGIPRLLERLGFTWKGVLQGHYKLKSGCYDGLLYTIIG